MGTSADFFAAFLGGLAGGAIVWHFKTQLVNIGRQAVSLFKGAQYLVAKAQEDLAKLEAKVSAVKAAIQP